jgi:hypothetical protein
MDRTKSLNSPPHFLQQNEAEYWIRVVEDLKLSDVEMKKIIDELAKVLKGKKNQEEYFAHVEAHIYNFTQKVTKHQAHKEILTIGQQLHEEAHEGEEKIGIYRKPISQIVNKTPNAQNYMANKKILPIRLSSCLLFKLKCQF